MDKQEHDFSEVNYLKRIGLLDGLLSKHVLLVPGQINLSEAG